MDPPRIGNNSITNRSLSVANQNSTVTIGIRMNSIYEQDEQNESEEA